MHHSIAGIEVEIDPDAVAVGIAIGGAEAAATTAIVIERGGPRHGRFSE